MKIKGLNDKEQKCYDVLCDGAPHTIAELKKKFMAAAKKHCEETYEKGSWDEDSVDIHAQSFVRNSIRRLIRDGWVEKKAYGTYQLTRSGKKWVADGKDTTASFGVKRGRKPKSEEEKAKAKKAKATKAKAPAKAKKTKTTKAKTAKKASTKAKTAKKAKAPAKPKTKAKAAPAKPKTKAKTAKSTNGKAVAKKKAKEAHKRAAKAASVEKAQRSLAEESSAS